MVRTVRIGVLALQGDFAEHVAMLRRIDRELGSGGALRADDGSPWRVDGVQAAEVRLPEQLAAVDALIIPGGESTTIGQLLVEYGLLEPLRRRVALGMSVFGTCAGAIVLAKDIGGLRQPLVGAMDLTVRRNAFGRQLQSFETDLPMPVLGEGPLRAIFIRGPAILAVGDGVEVLARLPDGTIVAARQGNLLATAFHPELTDDTRVHRYFVRMVADCLMAGGVGGNGRVSADDRIGDGSAATAGR
jgi:5'-phosphate synthase pdxT subunit